jgi:hypothetical protein
VRKLRLEIRGFHVEPTHHAGDELRAGRDVEQEIRLRAGLGGLNSDRPRNAETPKRGREVLGHVVAQQYLGSGIHPAVVATRRPPDMMMRVDDHRALRPPGHTDLMPP